VIALHDYGLSAREIRRLPGGYHGSAYVVDEHYVVKFYPAPPALDLLVTLAAAGLPVAPPIPTLSGALWAARGDLFMALFPLVRGQTPTGWPRWDRSILVSLGALIRRFHEVRCDGMPVDSLTVPAHSLPADAPYAAEFASQLQRLQRLGFGARATVWEPVLCHTDVGGDNILRTPSGDLVLLDWDEAVAGPPENDFVLFARDGGLDEVLAGYGGALDPHRLAFCQLRRYLGDAWVRYGRLLDPACPDRAAVEADLVEWGVRPWRSLPDPH
jgi:Ser/Thr protein kinase RdoA (MazF antagonist)